MTDANYYLGQSWEAISHLADRIKDKSAIISLRLMGDIQIIGIKIHGWEQKDLPARDKITSDIAKKITEDNALIIAMPGHLIPGIQERFTDWHFFIQSDKEISLPDLDGINGHLWEEIMQDETGATYLLSNYYSQFDIKIKS